VPRGRWRRRLGATGVAKDAGNNLICILQSRFLSGSLTLSVPPASALRLVASQENVISSLFAKRTLAAIEKKISFFSLSIFSCSYQLFKSHYRNRIYIFQYLSILFWLYIYLESSFLTHSETFIHYLIKKNLVYSRKSRIFFGSEGRKNKPK